MWKSNNILSVNAKMLKIAGLFRSFLITKFMVKDTFQCNIYRLTSVIFLYTADQKTAQTFLTTAVDLYGTLSAGVTPSVPSKNIYFVHSIWRLISPWIASTCFAVWTDSKATKDGAACKATQPGKQISWTIK